MAITVLEIQKLACLTKMNLIAGENGLNKEVQWIYIAECFEDPLEGTKWLQGGEIVFITGLAVKGRLNILEQLIQDIYDKKGVALIVNIGPYINKVPKNAIDKAECFDCNNTITKYTDIGVFSLLFNIHNKETLKSYYNNILGSIENHTDYINILEVYLGEDCNLLSTAEKLFIHRNTLTYRINKIEKILNRNLHSFQDCVEIKLALYIRKILSKQ